jgi:hypothetical protein
MRSTQLHPKSISGEREKWGEREGEGGGEKKIRGEDISTLSLWNLRVARAITQQSTEYRVI